MARYEAGSTTGNNNQGILFLMLIYEVDIIKFLWHNTLLMFMKIKQ